eukprot:4102149-Prymnesium_polylepis.1
MLGTLACEHHTVLEYSISIIAASPSPIRRTIVSTRRCAGCRLSAAVLTALAGGAARRAAR